MNIKGVIWLDQFATKIEARHGLSIEEVEEVFYNHKSHFERVEKGNVKGEDLYICYGQTGRNQYIVIYFINKLKQALPISARRMTDKQKRYYARQKKQRE